MTVYNPAEYGTLDGLGNRYFSAENALAESLNQFMLVAAVIKFVKSRPSETFRNQSKLSDDELVEAILGLVS